MKNKLLSLILFLGSYAAYSQVGIGTPMPNASAQLEVVASDKGVLIPRITLTGSTDIATITSGNVNSLLVFNTASVSDVTPGYYYWYNNKWNRIVISNEITASPDTVIFNPTTQQFTYVDASGITQVIDISTIVKASETLTTLVNNGAGSYTYKNEAGTPVNIDVVGDVTSNFSTIVNNPAVTSVIENIVNKTDGNVTFDSTTNQFSYVDATGTTQLVDISTIVKASETLTTLDKDAANNGKYVYTSENATPTTIDVVGDVISNSTTILNDPAFKTELTNVIKTEETLTTLVNNGAGSYTYTNEAGTPVNIDVVGDVTSNFSTIVNDPAVTTIIENIVNTTEGNVTFDAATNQFSYIDATGTTQLVDITTIVKASETLTTLDKDAANNGKYVYTSENATPTTIDVVGDVISNSTTILNDPAFKTELTNVIKTEETLTTLVNNGAGSYTYTNEAGTPVNIDVVGDVTSNFSTIVNDPAVTTIIENIVNTTEGNVTFDAATNQFSYVDATGTTQLVDITTIVKASETLTTLDKDAANNGKYVYTSENATPTTIDVVGDVITNSSTILNDPAFKTEITNVIKAEETLTTLVNNGAGSYTYTNEAGTPVNIDVVGDVTSNFSTIASDPAVTTIIENIVNTTEGNVTFDAATNQFSYVDATGTTQLVDITTIVKANETLTTLTKDASNNGTYLYTSENATPTTIDVVGDVISNSTTILNDPAFKTELTNVIKTEETITTLTKDASNNGTYLYTSENATPTTIDVVGDVITNSSTILNNPAFKTELTNVIKTEETVTTQAQSLTTGAITYTNEAGTAAISQVVSANAGNIVTVGTDGGALLTPAVLTAATTVSNASSVNTLTTTVNGVASTGAPIVNTNATSLTGANLVTTINGVASAPLDLSPAIAAGQITTTLTKDAANNGTYLYTSEDATATTIDVVGDVITNASTILNDPAFKTELSTVIKAEETLTTQAQNLTTGAITYTNEAGTAVVSQVVSTAPGNLVTVGVDGGGFVNIAAIKANETLTTQAQNVTTGAITYTNEAGTPAVSQVVSANAGNLVTVGTDGGALLTAAAITTPTTVSNTSLVNNLTTTVNGIAAASVPIVNSNTASLTGSNLTTTVNGVASAALDLSPAIAAGQITTTQAQNLTTGAITYTNEAGTPAVSQVVSANAGNLVTVGTDGGALLTAAAITTPTTVSNTSLVNNLTTTVNGIAAASVPIVNSNTASLTGSNLTTTVNGVASAALDLSPAIAAGQITTTLAQNLTTGAITYTNEAGTPAVSQVVSANAGNIVTVGTDGGALLTPTALTAATTVSNASSVNTGTITVNGVVSTGAPIVNSNAASLTGTSLITTVNGVASTALDLSPAIAAAQTVTTQAQNLTTGAITYTNEVGTPVVSQVVSTDAGNLVSVGIDGGAFVNTAVIKANETLTAIAPIVTTGNTIANYTNEAAGTPVDIKETITSLTDVVTQVEDPPGQITDLHTLTYTDETNTAFPIDLSILVKGVETLTSLVYDGSNQSLIYKDEVGNSAEFKMVDLVGDVQTLTTLQVNSATGTLDFTDEHSTVNTIDLSQAVKEPWFSVATNIGATLNTENIYTNGWVGIGYATPSAAINEKLRVNGAITTINSYYADYVFEDYFKGFSEIKADYKFKNLNEVEDYIKENKHLPGITPITELEKTKEGYSFNMSELSIQLLEKTEEIYLHIIEQNKEIVAKDKEIKELKEISKSMNLRLEKLEKLILEKNN